MGLRYFKTLRSPNAHPHGDGFNPLLWGLGILSFCDNPWSNQWPGFQSPSMGLRYFKQHRHWPEHCRKWFQSPSMGLRYFKGSRPKQSSATVLCFNPLLWGLGILSYGRKHHLGPLQVGFNPLLWGLGILRKVTQLAPPLRKESFNPLLWGLGILSCGAKLPGGDILFQSPSMGLRYFKSQF